VRIHLDPPTMGGAVQEAGAAGQELIEVALKEPSRQSRAIAPDLTRQNTMILSQMEILAASGADYL